MKLKIKPLLLVLVLCLAQIQFLGFKTEIASASPAVSEQPSEQWSRTFGGSGDDLAASVQQTSDGGYILARNAGEAQSMSSIVDGTLGADPSLSWSKTFGGEDDDWAWSVIQTSDGGYALAGYTESYGAGGFDFWLVKTDSSGNEEWSKTFGGENPDWAWSVIQTSDGGYALAGYTGSYGAGGDDFWLVKTDSAGNEEWNKTFGGENPDAARSVIQTSDGGYALAGVTESYGAGGDDFWLVKTDSAGNEEWNKTFGGENPDWARSVIQISDGGYALAGYTESYGAGGDDFWLVKTDSAGNEEWNKTFGGEDSDAALSVIQTSDGGYALAGFTGITTGSYGARGSDFWLVKTDSAGNEEWNKTFGGTSADGAYSVIQTSDGGYALAGLTDCYGAGGSDFWLVKTDSSGNEEWNKTFGGARADSAFSAIKTSDGGYALAGNTNSYGAGGFDFWLVKTEGEGAGEIPIIYVAGAVAVIVVALALILHKMWRTAKCGPNRVPLCTYPVAESNSSVL
jgi:hypothetical protein